MAELNLKYYNNTDIYSDGDIENDILDIVKGVKDISDFYDEYAVIYHLSPVRENIVNWYPFKKDGNCLEIGAGCGAITGALCRKNGNVVSVDISKRRSEINYERHKDYENLEIIAGNIHEIEFRNKFDYIILNGVFEYAISFTHTKGNPYIELLKTIKKLLKKRGHVLIAIENRLGLKYFNGAPEDHTDEYFLGINNYANNNNVRTFSKSEIGNIIEKSGFRRYKFYYPYPDYKFPFEIFTDTTINEYKYGRPYYNINSRVFSLFDEYKTAASLSEEKITDRFANSFLIEISNGDKFADIVYAKINSQRNERFRIATVISENEGGRVVEKCPLTKEAEEHVDKIYNNSLNCFIPGIRNCEFTKKDKSICYNYYDYKNLDDIILEYIADKDCDSIISAIEEFFSPIIESAQYKKYHTEDFSEVFGDVKCNKELLCVNPANIDLICDNIMPVENEYIVIDTEWIFDIDVPVLFILWRNLRELYTRHHELNDIISFEDFLLRFNIDNELSEIFRKWTMHFVNDFVENGLIDKIAVNKKNIDLNTIYYLMFNESESCLYIDYGNGYNEDDKIVSRLNVDNNGNFTVRFNLPEGNYTLRWDPVENRCCKCCIEYINGEAKPLNGKKCGKFDVFETGDPQYEIQTSKRYLIIKGRIAIDNIYESSKFFEEKMNGYKGELDYKNSVIREIESDRNQLNKKIGELNEEAFNLKNRNDELITGNIVLNRRIDEVNKSQAYLVNKIKELNLNIQIEQNKYNEIINSKGWRFLDKLRKIAILFRR